MFDLSGKTALVTGSSRGLGAGMAFCLAEAGADVILNYTSESSASKAEALKEKILAMGRRCIVVQADVSSEEDVKRMAETIDNEFGVLDILCSNAGITTSGLDIDHLDYAEWQRVINTNLGGAFLVTKYTLPLIRKSKAGRIIYTSSIVAHQGALFGQVHYASTKGALISFAKTLARTLAPEKITVNTISPGTHLTEGIAQVHGTDAPNDRMAGIIAKIPLGYLGDDKDIGYGVVYLASDEAHYITGATLDVNGGFVMR